MADPLVPHALDVTLRHRRGALALVVQFRLRSGWTVLFGPSGSGKTTILRSLAGLLRADHAVITGPAHPALSLHPPAAPVVLEDTARGIFLPPHRRAMPLVPQRPALFPHRTVRDNLSFALPRTGGRAPADPRHPLPRHSLPQELHKLLGIDGLLDRYPHQLSGGEAQRVSIARALAAPSPRLLLLDEPLSGLDPGLRASLVELLLAWQQRQQVPILSVTHDVAEAFQLGAEVIQLHQGRVAAQGPVEQVLAGERSRLLRQLGAHDIPVGSAEPFLAG
ncbi:MAG: ATP-binding cassette domain-containing protein [Acidobacteriota bacterium]|nr:ATP-binding cassette domain-containing protein [Acidobacteriota bacterium]